MQNGDKTSYSVVKIEKKIVSYDVIVVKDLVLDLKCLFSVCARSRGAWLRVQPARAVGVRTHIHAEE